ncbi:MAG: hypothetical protein WC058_12015 [Phycisphaeraceae bacterium]
MKPMRMIGGIALCVICAAGGYWAANRAGASERQPTRVEMLLRWLEVTPEQREVIVKADPTFIDESAVLAAQLRAERAKMAGMLRAGDANELLSAQLEAAIAVEEALERRSGTFVLTIRPLLNAGQQKKLLDLVAQGLMENGGAHLRDPVTDSGK